MDSNTIAAVTSIASLLTALAAFITILELKKQRTSSIKPELVAVTQRIIAQDSLVIQAPAPVLWIEDYVSEKVDIPILPNYSARIYNVGNGPARSLSFQWSFDLSGTVEKVNRLSQKLFANHFVEVSSSNWLSYRTKVRGSSEVNLELDLKGQHDFVLPASISPTACCVRFPTSYVYLVSSYIVLTSKDSSGGTGSLDVPELCLRISYLDRDGNTFNAEIVYKMSVVALSSGKEDEVGCFHAVIEPSRCRNRNGFQVIFHKYGLLRF